MEWSDLLKLAHVALAFAFVAGLIGRWILLWRAERANDLAAASLLAEAASPFERTVILSSILVLPAGLLTAWAQGYPWLGATTGWMLASLVIYFALLALVPMIFLPRGRRFDAAMADARRDGSMTAELRGAFADPAVRFARNAELVGVGLIVGLMVLKPF
jgi:hypothetical protein